MKARFVALGALVSLSLGCSPYSGDRQYEEGLQKLEGLSFFEKRAGKLLWELKSPNGILLEEQGLAKLELPEIAFYQDGSLSSRAKSLKGTIQTGTHEIELSSGVVLTAYADNAVLKTESLRYSSSRNLIFSDLPVDLERPNARIHGEGLEATPDLREIRIKKQRTVIKE